MSCLKNPPWKPTTGYEMIDAYPVVSIPIINERWIPSYAPDGMITTPLTFPNLVTGYNQKYVALESHCTIDDWNKNRQCIQEKVESCLKNLQPIKDTLENLVRKKKNKLEAIQNENDCTEKTQAIDGIKSRVCELSSLLEKIIITCGKMQDCKRKLQACTRGIEAPLQVSQECLYHREQRDKFELINDRVEQLLVKETKGFCQTIQQLQACLKCCENQLLEGRKYQYDLENCIKKAQWAICVDKSKEAIDRLLESDSWMKQAECLKKKACPIIANMEQLQQQVDANIKKSNEQILKIWNETNVAFAKRCIEMKHAKDEIEHSIVKIKNEIINVEKNLKYLETNKDKEIYGDLQQGKDQLKILLRTKKTLEAELSSKLKSLFIDTQECMSMRKSFPISITLDH